MKEILLTIAACMLLACNKEAEMPTPPAASFLMFYNGVADFYGLNSLVLVNNTANASLDYNNNGRGLVGAFNASQYNLADTGTFRIGFTGTPDADGKADKLTEGAFRLEQDRHYTLYLADSLGFYETIITKDDTKPDPVKARIRLIHLSADAGQVFVKLDTAAVKGMENIRFRQVSDYIDVAPDVKPGIRIMYHDPVTGEEKSLTRKSFPLEAGKCYTMILRGYKTPADGNANKTINLSTIINF